MRRFPHDSVSAIQFAHVPVIIFRKRIGAHSQQLSDNMFRMLVRRRSGQLQCASAVPVACINVSAGFDKSARRIHSSLRTRTVQWRRQITLSRCVDIGATLQ